MAATPLVVENYPTSDGLYTGETRLHPMKKYADQLLKHGFGTLLLPDGRKYEGRFEFDAMHGSGVMRYPNGDVYEGEFQGSQRCGVGVLEQADGGSYEGYFKEDVRWGAGTQIYSNGDRYEGMFAGDVRSGFGRLSFANGERYEGHFQDDLFEGDGILHHLNGDCWEGKWKAGKRHGRGSHVKPSGVICEEQYEDGVAVRGVCTGHGTVAYPNGDKYTGEWSREAAGDSAGDILGGRHGHGELFLANGDHYEGEFADDMMEGKGVYTFAGPSTEGIPESEEPVTATTEDGRRPLRYEGTFHRGRPHGFGVMHFRGGDRHEGFWKESATHGLGFVVDAGDAFEGAWSAFTFEEGTVASEGKWNVVLRPASSS